MKTKEIHQFTFHKLSEKDLKSLKILDLITKKVIISRTEISRITGINIVSVSNYIKRYIEMKLIMEKGFDVSTGGRKPELVELNKEENRVIGVEIGKDLIRGVFTDVGLSVYAKAEIPKAGRNAKEVTAEICALIENMKEKAGVKDGGLKAIGVGTSAYDNEYISREVRGKFGVEVFVTTFAVKLIKRGYFVGRRDIQENLALFVQLVGWVDGKRRVITIKAVYIEPEP